MNTIILFTILGGLILLWGAILALINWMSPVQNKHILGLGAYISVVAGVLLFLVVHTSMKQQERALQDTRTRLNQELETFRDRLSQLTDKLMGQIAEKAELTQSEMEVRGNLQTERAEHARNREVLAQTEERMGQVGAELDREKDAHRAYLDSLNTERALHQSTRELLGREEKTHGEARQKLEAAQEALAKTRERLTVQETENARLKVAQAKMEEGLKAAATAQEQLLTQFETQKQNMHTLQASIDSICVKTLKRRRPK